MTNDSKPFYKFLSDNNYIFPIDTIENFLLSLRVKPFLILTGNSGTGKTRLAQMFAEYENLNTEIDLEPYTKDNFNISINLDEEEYYNFEANLNNTASGLSKETFEKKEGSPEWTLSPDLFEELFSFSLYNKIYDATVDGYEAKVQFKFNVKLSYDNEELKEYLRANVLSIKENTEEYNSHWDKKSIPVFSMLAKIKTRPLRRIWKTDFKKNEIATLNVRKTGDFVNGKLFTCPYEVLDYFPFVNDTIKANFDIHKIISEGTFWLLPRLKIIYPEDNVLKEYVQQSDKESFEVKIDFRDLDYRIGDKLVKNCSNHELVSVGANWTDNRNLLGYENILTNSYQSTPTLELMLKAKNDPKNPYFLILDEMNLSHVERYFADFLSSIESGKPLFLYTLKEIQVEENGKMIKKFNKDVYKVVVDGYTYNIPPKLTIPDNLYIIGTVNIDETTYMFSPKVLDRANVIEFETFSAMDYMHYKKDDKKQSRYKESIEDFSDETTIKDMDIEELNTFLSNYWENLSKELVKFQTVLKNSNFDFGFRVTNEILRYMAMAYQYDNNQDKFNWETVFDYQIKQKILPKLHGSENVIGETLDNLIKLSYYGIEIDYESENELFEELEGYSLPNNEIGSKYENSTKKLLQMKKTLDKQRYMSFIN